MKSGEKLEKVVKSWKSGEKLEKWRKVGISGESWGKVGKSGEKRRKASKSWKEVGIFFAKWPRRTFWMTKNHFRSHFSPFQINTQLFFLNFVFKMAAGRHFGSLFWAILDDRKSLSIAFLAISDQYATFFFDFFSKCHLKTIGLFHYVLSMTMPNMKLIGEAFEHFYTKWPPEAILFFRLMTKIIGFL